MAFIRKKIIKGKSYYYLVKSIRKNKAVRQKVIRYLGKSADLAKKL